MKHIEIDNKKCCGCSACQAVCPVSAIKMQEDVLGFLYPEIQEETCIECGKCITVCQIDTPVLHTTEKQSYYAAQHHDNKIRMESSSGGVFLALAKAVIDDNGVVCGAFFDAEWKVMHKVAETFEDAKSFQGSKYIQSDNQSIYKYIVENLKNSRKVLYSGTPCQCQGILQYLNGKNINTEKLYLVDFVCHGVGSPEIWKKYVDWLEKEHGKVKFVTFRDKENGWNKSRTKILNNEDRDISLGTYSYFDMYRSLLTTRDSCFECEFTDYRRCTDLTLGDFWNIGTLEHNFDSEGGVSQILVNTDKGKELLEKAGSQLSLLSCTKKDCWQPHLEYPIEKPHGKEKFLNLFQNQDFEIVLKKYGNGTKFGKCKKIMVSIVRKIGLYVWAGKLFKLITGNGRKRG